MKLMSMVCALALSSSALASERVGVIAVEMNEALAARVWSAAAQVAGVQKLDITRQHVAAAAALGIKCARTDVNCWRQVRDIAGVDVLLVSAPEADGTLSLSAVGTDATKDVLVSRVEVDGDALLDAIAVVLRREATLSVMSDVDDAEVSVDGYIVGKTPLKDSATAPGERRVQVKTSDGRVLTFEVSLKPGESRQVDARFVVAGGAEGGGRLPLVLVGGGAVLLVAGLATWGTLAAISPDAPSSRSPADIDDVVAANDLSVAGQTAGVVVGLTGVVVAAVGAAMLLGVE